MFEISKRLEQANQAANPREHKESEQVKAGRDAENSFVSSLRSKSFDMSSLFCGLRVPDEYQSRKREIDVVLLTNGGIFCIEIKNWGGRIECSTNGDKWIQTKQRKFAEHSYVTNHIEHDNGVTEIKRKASLLRDYLCRKDCYISEDMFRCRVVFVNPNSDLEDSILNDPHVVKPCDSEAFISSFQRGYLELLNEVFVPSWFKGQLSNSLVNQARTILCTIGTWDIVELNGGKRLYGDYREISGISIDRKTVEALEFSHQRNRTLSLTWAVLGYSPTVTVSLLERGGSGWLWNAYCAVMRVAYNTEMVFRICGDEVDSRIPLNDIHRVIISN